MLQQQQQQQPQQQQSCPATANVSDAVEATHQLVCALCNSVQREAAAGREGRQWWKRASHATSHDDPSGLMA
jgi:hypothetical protein